MSDMNSLRALAAAAALCCLSTAHAGNAVLTRGATAGGTNLVSSYVDVNLAGFQTVGDFGDPGNTSVLVSIGAGSTVTGWDYIGLSYATQGESYLSEFVLSVNNSDASSWMDATLSDVDDPGTFGPASGSFGVTTPLYDGDPFVASNGTLLVTAYELYDDDGIDAVVSAGTLRVYFTSVVPEPGTYGMMALGLFAVGAAARRRTLR